VFDKGREQVNYLMPDPVGFGGNIGGLNDGITVQDAVSRFTTAYNHAYQSRAVFIHKYTCCVRRVAQDQGVSLCSSPLLPPQRSDLQSNADIKELTASLKQLADEKSDLNQSSPQIPRRRFERARTGIEAGEATYRVDDTAGLTRPPEKP
jgi:hypothetical protein